MVADPPKVRGGDRNVLMAGECVIYLTTIVPFIGTLEDKVTLLLGKV